MKAIAVFPKSKNWVEMGQLFSILRFMGVTIEGQDTYGDYCHEGKADYLIIEDKIARWVDEDGFMVLSNQQWISCLHFDSLCYSIKNFGVEK